MHLSCPACHAPFSADDTHPALGIANCRTCRGVLDLRAASRPLDIPRPPRFTVEDDVDRLRISWRWRERQHIAATALLLMTWLFEISPVMDVGWLWLLQPVVLGFTALLVVLLYVTAAKLCNRTVITVDGAGKMTIRMSPLRWPGERTFAPGQLIQLFVRCADEGAKTRYWLCAIDVLSGRVDLARGLLEYDEAHFLERRLERRLGIRDRAVEGEARA